jgi:hypothetical protein
MIYSLLIQRLGIFGQLTSISINRTSWQTGALVFFCNSSAFGSYGGIGHELAGLFLFVACIVAIAALAIVFLIVKAMLGDVVAVMVVFAIVLWGLYEMHQYDQEIRAEGIKRRQAYSQIEHNYSEGCNRATQVFDFTTKPVGNERILFRIDGADKVPEYQRSELLPSTHSVPAGIEVVRELPSDLSNTIVVNMRLNRELVPGSYQGYEWYRTHYELVAKSMPNGTTVAYTVDMEKRSGFCLGGLEQYLRRMLNRPNVMRTN